MFLSHVTDFAVTTKHRPHQYETPQQTNEIARKMLASSIRAVPWQDVYRFVSPGDMQRIVTRIKPLDLGTMCAPPAEYYLDLSQRVVHNRDTSRADVLDSFEEHVFPSIKKKDKNTPLALFLCKASNGDVRSLENSIWPGYENKKQREHIYDAIKSYGSKKHKDDSVAVVARFIGFIIRNIHFPEIEDGSIFMVEPY